MADSIIPVHYVNAFNSNVWHLAQQKGSRLAGLVRVEIQKDDRIRKWIYVKEVDKYLRVILLSDGVTVHNAFFDRNFQE